MSGTKPEESSKNVSNGIIHPDHVDKRPPIPSASSTPTTRMKLGFRDRHWTEIEKLWRGKAKDPPNIESLLKPQANYRSKDRQARARTLPFTATSNPSEIPASSQMTTSVSVSHLGCGARSQTTSLPRWPPPSPSTTKPRQAVHKTMSSSAIPRSPQRGPLSTTASLLAAHSQAVLPAMSLGRMDSPLETRKAIDLLAPHVFNTWQARDFTSIQPSFDAVSMSSNESQEEETDHFVELVKQW